MVVVSQPPLDNSFIKTCKPIANTCYEIPVIDMRSYSACTRVVEACESFGFFKVINHGVSYELMSTLEAYAVKFFNMSQTDKNRAGSPKPFGYGNKKIGANGDVGWVEYLLFGTKGDQFDMSIVHEDFDLFSGLLEEYAGEMRRVAGEVLGLIGEGLRLGESQRGALIRMVEDEDSDSCFRLNHYPPCEEMFQALSGRSLIGFGEHTDPQIISILRSNNTSGLQIALKDGSWAAVPPDQHSFFINVSDCLQVLTNGRFKSVKHRVVTDSKRSRLSMIYFGGPALQQKIAPIDSLMEDGEESLYKEFTWSEYKNSVFKSKLAVNRLQPFEKSRSIKVVHCLTSQHYALRKGKLVRSIFTREADTLSRQLDLTGLLIEPCGANWWDSMS